MVHGIVVRSLIKASLNYFLLRTICTALIHLVAGWIGSELIAL